VVRSSMVRYQWVYGATQGGFLTLARCRNLDPQEARSLESIGVKLRVIRKQRQLSLRAVEQRSLQFAKRRGNHSYRVSASWLDRLEREKHELTISKLIALADIYDVPPEELLQSVCLGATRTPTLKQLSVPNATMLLADGPLGVLAEYLLPERQPIERFSDETTMLMPQNGHRPMAYRRGVVGKRDNTLDPMIPGGSVVYIDTTNRLAPSRKKWTHEFKRPMYFAMTESAYHCGWFDFDRASGWMTSIPHPLSVASSRTWKYGTEIEIVGLVAVVAIPLIDQV
jgi:transcriptional regulator with XRE-family HTH domain